MLTSEDKERLVDDLLGTNPSGFKDQEGALSPNAKLQQYLFLVVSSYVMFPELFYAFATKLINVVKADLTSVKDVCTLLTADIAALSRETRSQIDTQPLKAAVQSLSLMTSTIPKEGDPAYRKYKRSLDQFYLKNKEFLKNDGSGGIARTAEEAFDDLRTHVEDLRTAVNSLIEHCTYLSIASTTFDDVEWQSLLATYTSNKAKEKMLLAWRDVFVYGKRKIGDILYTTIASSAVLEKLLETPRARDDIKWSGTTVPSGPFTTPEVGSNSYIPYSPGVGNVLSYSVNGTTYTVAVNPFGAMAMPSHILLPLPVGATDYTIVAGNDVLYLTVGAVEHRIPILAGVYSTFNMAAALVTGVWATLEVPDVGVLLYHVGVPLSTPAIATGKDLGLGVFESTSAHISLGVAIGDQLLTTINLKEAELLYASPYLTFFYNTHIPPSDYYSARICTDGAAPVASTDSVVINTFYGTASLGLWGTSLPASNTLIRSDTLGRVLVGDILTIYPNEYTILLSKEEEIKIEYLRYIGPTGGGGGTSPGGGPKRWGQDYLKVRTYTSTIIGPEVAAYVGVEDLVLAFLDDLTTLGITSTSLGKLDQIGGTIPTVALRLTIATLVTSLSALCTALSSTGVLSTYVGRVDPMAEDLLVSLDTAGYERASTLLKTCRFSEFIYLTPATASREGGVTAAVVGVERSMPTNASSPMASLPNPVVTRRSIADQ